MTHEEACAVAKIIAECDDLYSIPFMVEELVKAIPDVDWPALVVEAHDPDGRERFEELIRRRLSGTLSRDRITDWIRTGQ